MIRSRLNLGVSAGKIIFPFVVFLCCMDEMPRAQEQPSVPNQEEEAARIPTTVRGWLLPGADSKNLVLRFRPATGEGATVALASSQAGAPSLADSFNAVAAGSYVCELVAGEAVLFSKQVRLPAAKSMTLICLPGEDGKFEFRLFDDGPLPVSPGERSLRVLNFADGREASLQIDGKGALSLAADSVQEVKLEPRLQPISVSVKAKDGTHPAQSFVVVDLSASASAYLAILPDSKGRMRPRSIPGAAPPPPASTIPFPETPPPTPEQVRAERVAVLERDLDSAQARLALLDAAGGRPNSSENASQVREDLEQKITETRKRIQATKSAPLPPPVGQPPPHTEKIGTFPESQTAN